MLRKLSVVFVSLVILGFVSPVLAGQCLEGVKATEKKQLKGVFSDLYLGLASRPGVSPAKDVAVLRSAARAAARSTICFLDSAGATNALVTLAPQLQTALDEYTETYTFAAVGLAGAEARGTAMHALLNTFFSSAEQSGLSLELFNFALDKGLSRFESRLERSKIAIALSLESRELIDLLLIDAARQFSFRSWISGDVSAKSLLGIDPAMILSEQSYALANNALLVNSVALEEDLSDPLIVSNAQSLIHAQFNQEARHDLALFRIGFELYGLQQARDPQTILEILVSRMDTVGGVMSGLTPQQIEQSGINYHGLVFDWVNPELALNYRPDSSLVEMLVATGSVVPQPPLFEYFSDPYLAFLQFEYDMSLANELFKAEEALLIDETMATGVAPLSMQDRFKLRSADRNRRLEVLRRMAGLGQQEKEALLVLLTSATI